MSIKVSINPEHYRRILQALRTVERSDESVLRSGVNNTARIVQRNLASKAAHRYAGGAGKRSTILATSEIKKATAANPTAIINFRSPIRDVKEYSVRIGRRAISAAVLNTGFKKIDKGFVAGLSWTARSGSSGTHEAVMQRVEGTVAKQYAGKPAKPHYNKIRKVLSPSVQKQIDNPHVYSEAEVAETLRAEVDKVVGKVLGG